MTDLPSCELVQRFMHETGFSIADPDDEAAFPEAKFMKLASRLIQYGADMELDACCEWLSVPCPSYGRELRNARRPKPPSLKEQALALVEQHEDGWRPSPKDWDTIRKALEALPND